MGIVTTLTGIRIKTINEAYSSGGSNASAIEIRGIHMGMENNGELPNFATVTNTIGFDLDISNNTSGCIVNSYGIRLNTPTNSGTITNHYGLYIGDQTLVNTPISYSLYIAGGRNYISGSIGFYGHTSASRPAKAEHNNWAAISDVVQALVDIGLLDTV